MTNEQIDEVLNKEIDENYEQMKELFDGDYRLEVSECFTFTEEEEEDDEGMENFEARMWARFTLLMKD